MSFLETGRSRPGRDVLARLAAVLELPLRQVNVLLESAGYARMFAESSLGDSEVERVREILAFVLDRYEPYGAVVIDAGWTLLMANRAHRRLAAYLLGPESAEEPSEPNLLLQLFRPGGFRERLVNWPEVAHHLLERLRRQVAENPAREDLRSLLETLEAQDLPPEPPRVPPVVPLLPMHFAVEGTQLRLVSLITTFGAPQDVAAQELRLEAFLPADAASDDLIRALAAAEAEDDYPRSN
jgi:hypothetical protein